MPGSSSPRIKSEPLSDEEDNTQAATSVDTLSDVYGHQNADVLEELCPAGPAATRVMGRAETGASAPVLLQTLEPQPRGAMQKTALALNHQMGLIDEAVQSEFVPLLHVKDEPLSEGEQQQLSGEDTSDSCGTEPSISSKPAKTWSQRDMDSALEALRKHHMSLTKASATYGIPSTTLWQRAHRLGIDTPKKEGSAKSWSPQHLRAALHALRSGAISANKASKAYGIPSSTLYKIARREGIRLAAPFNAAPTTWSTAALTRALLDIRSGRASVQRASTQYGIPTGTLYGRCKREGIELSRSNPTPWSENAMGEALEAVRVGQMSINQAAIHYNLPYSSLYGRFKRCKYQPQPLQHLPLESSSQEAMDLEPNPDFYAHYHNQAGQYGFAVHHAATPELHNPYTHHMSSEITPVHDNSMTQEIYSNGQTMYYAHNGITIS